MTVALALLEPQAPDTCPECGTTGLIRDASRGEVVCPGCGHYDELNRCCWVSWRNHAPGDYCEYGLLRDEDGMIVKVLWKKEAEA